MDMYRNRTTGRSIYEQSNIDYYKKMQVSVRRILYTLVGALLVYSKLEHVIYVDCLYFLSTSVNIFFSNC